MTEQQYRVIADRDKGDDPQWDHTEIGDRFTHVGILGGESQLVRIERPLPADKHPWTYNGYRYTDEQVAVCPSTVFTFAPRDERTSQPPTREQIAEAALPAMALAIPDRGARTRAAGRVADAVLALLQKGGDR